MSETEFTPIEIKDLTPKQQSLVPTAEKHGWTVDAYTSAMGSSHFKTVRFRGAGSTIFVTARYNGFISNRYRQTAIIRYLSGESKELLLREVGFYLSLGA